jgi:hypothetical protein
LNSDDQYSFSLSTRASFSLIAGPPFTHHWPLKKSAMYQRLGGAVLEISEIVRYPWQEISDHKLIESDVLSRKSAWGGRPQR